MSSEIVGSTSPCSEPNIPDDYQPCSQRTQGDTCFNCHKQGHWARDCPNKSKSKPEPSGSRLAVVNGTDFPEKQCSCGGGTCLIRTSKTEKNPGRKFYSCSGKSGSRCTFFEWCDMASSDQRRNVPQSSYPMCSCGAGICTLLTEQYGENVGRKFFVCPVRRGQGACSFFQWQDSPGKTISNGDLDGSKYFNSPQSTSGSQEDTTTKIGDTGKEGNYNNLEGMVTCGLPEIGSPLSREGHVKEDTLGLGSGVDDSHLPLIGNLQLIDDDRTEAVVKPGKCVWCGKEGHWMNECVWLPSSSCFNSPHLTMDSQEDPKTRIGDTGKEGNDNILEGMVTCGLPEIGSPLSREGHVKEDTLGLGSGVNDSHLPLIGNLQLIDDDRTEAVVKPGKCFWCGKEGHWMNECVWLPSSSCFNSPHSTLDSQEDPKTRIGDIGKEGKDNTIEGMVTCGLPEIGSPCSGEGHVKADTVGLGSRVDDAHLPPIGNLQLIDDNRTDAVLKPRKCFRCGKEGHWMKECVGPPIAPCFKCGKIGHWMKDCTV